MGADRRWVEQTALRFSPEPTSLGRWTGLLWLARALLLALLLVSLASHGVALIVWGACLLLPRRLAEWAWARRRLKIEDQLPLTITFMANGVGSGLTLVQSIQRLAEQAPRPIRQEYRIIANRYALGSDLETALLETKRRLDLPSLNQFVSALLVNREMGGDIAATLRRIARSLERLKELRLNLLAQTSEGRTNIKFLTAMPLLILFMMRSIDPEGLHMLFSTLPGMAVLLTALTLTATGIYWAHKITSTEL